MREIKFRGRDGDNWYYGSLFVNECGHTVISAPKSFWMKPVNAETVGQYTGLKDSTGKEIYEGDILLCRHPCSLLPLELCDKSTVHFKDGMFVVSLENCIYTVNQILGVHNDGAVIIGNVHDNPELLEVEA